MICKVYKYDEFSIVHQMGAGEYSSHKAFIVNAKGQVEGVKSTRQVSCVTYVQFIYFFALHEVFQLSVTVYRGRFHHNVHLSGNQ